MMADVALKNIDWGEAGSNERQPQSPIEMTIVLLGPDGMEIDDGGL